MSFADEYLAEAAQIINALDRKVIERMAEMLARLRADGGRLFFLGVGGSAGNCGHAVNDFRKIAGIEAYAPTDNVSELTARANDDGWASIFVEWLKVSRLTARDMVFVFSVGGGNLEKNISPNLVTALEHAKKVGAKVLGVVGRDGGYTAKVGDAVCVIPTVNANSITPHTEAFHAVVWHLLVTHPALKASETKWEIGAVSAPRRAVFLDRDGVLNEVTLRAGTPHPPDSADDVVIPADAPAALTSLHDAGFALIVVTNQPDIVRGAATLESVTAINDRLRRALPIDAVEMCLHDDADACDCRKPLPGMLVRASQQMNIDLDSSFMIGDRWRDIDAGHAAGCKTILIGDGYGEGLRAQPDLVVETLKEAASWILAEAR